MLSRAIAGGSAGRTTLVSTSEGLVCWRVSERVFNSVVSSVSLSPVGLYHLPETQED